jgi:Histidine kinase
MKTFYFQFLLSVFFSYTLFSQHSDIKQNTTENALVIAINNAKSDTAKVRWQYDLGLLSDIKRLEYWDSLKLDAKNQQLLIFESRIAKRKGDLYYFQNERLKAISNYNESLLKADLSGNKLEKLSALYQINLNYIYFNNYKQALKHSYDGLKLAEAIDNIEWVANFKSQIGTIYFHLQDAQKALEQHLKALDIYINLDNNYLINSALCDVASDYSLLQDTANTIKYYLLTAKYTKKFGLSNHNIEAHKAVATAYLLMRKFDSSIYFLQKAIVMSDSLKLKASKASVMFLLSNCYYFKGDYFTAEKVAIASLKLCQTSKFILQLPSLYNLLNKIYLKEKKYKMALESYELYINNRDSLTNNKMHQEALQRQFDFEYEKKENENHILTQQNQIQTLKLQRNGYLLFGMIILLALAFCVAYLLIRQNKLKSAEQNMILEQKLLQTQMNPHFIFNALQAIQNSILKNDSKTAVKHLSSFAKLTRSVLENSRTNHILLKNEIELLENYLQLQKMRFRDRFDYEIKCDEAIDTNNQMIAPMLSQPFIENAIEHGFNDIEKEGKTVINFVNHSSQLRMSIIDNGAGMQVNNIDKIHSKSLSIEITKNRIAIINQNKKGSASFKITEAFPEELKRKGVKVSFTLPIIFLEK